MTNTPANPGPAVDFSTFILSLASSAMLHLGKVPDPAGQTIAPNLSLAKQSIDMLEMIKSKTQGNLSPEEVSLLARLLHDVRIAYVHESKNQVS